MEIRIRLESAQPPEGCVGSQQDDSDAPKEIRFTGWLGLLQALDDLIGPEEP